MGLGSSKLDFGTFEQDIGSFVAEELQKLLPQEQKQNDPNKQRDEEYDADIPFDNQARREWGHNENSFNMKRNPTQYDRNIRNDKRKQIRRANVQRYRDNQSNEAAWGAEPKRVFRENRPSPPPQPRRQVTGTGWQAAVINAGLPATISCSWRRPRGKNQAMTWRALQHMESDNRSEEYIDR